MGQPNGDPAAGDGGNAGEGEKGDEGKNEFKPVTYKTQEELDAAFGERATRAANTARSEALKAFTDAGVSAEDALAAFNAQKAAEDAKKSPAVLEREKREATERELERYKSKEARGKLADEVAKTVKFGETPIPASLLAGDTKEEIESHAKAIVDFFNSVSGPRPPGYNADQGQNGQDQGASTDPIREYMATGQFL